MIDINNISNSALALFHNVVSTLSYNDPMMKPVVSLFIIGVVGILARIIFRKYPRMVYLFFKNKLIYSVTIINDNNSDSMNYDAFMRFYEKNRPEKGTRRFRLMVNAHRTVLAADEGMHWFFFEKRYYWFFMTDLESTGADVIKSKVTIYSYGISISSLTKLVNAFCVKPPEKNGIYTEGEYSRDKWSRDSDIQDITLDDLILAPSMRKLITERLDWFLNNKEWYTKRFLDYKMNILLEGPPGTGKSYLIKAIANYLNRSMYLLDIHKSNSGFEFSYKTMPKSGMGVVEDFDDNPSLLKRTDDEGKVVSRKTEGVKLSTLLNIMQGVQSSSGTVLALSTNHIELLDPAIYRDGRVDLRIHVGPMENEQIHQYMARMYSPEQAAEIKEVFPPTTAATLSKFFMSNIDSIEGFRKDLMEYHQQQVLQIAA